MYLGGYEQDPGAPRMDSAGFIRGRGDVHAPRHSSLGGRPRLGLVFDRGGDQNLVRVPGPMKRDYRDKIKNLEELVRAIGARPRRKKVIMCHGTFDIVHPGHLRHLAYAKEK